MHCRNPPPVHWLVHISCKPIFSLINEPTLCIFVIYVMRMCMKGDYPGPKNSREIIICAWQGYPLTHSSSFLLLGWGTLRWYQKLHTYFVQKHTYSLRIPISLSVKQNFERWKQKSSKCYIIKYLDKNLLYSLLDTLPSSTRKSFVTSQAAGCCKIGVFLCSIFFCDLNVDDYSL